MKQVDPNEARQGFRGGRVLIVLLTSLVLASIVWAIVEFYGQMRPGRGFMDDNNSSPASTQSQSSTPATDAE